MTNIYQPEIELSITAPLADPPDESIPLTRYPELRTFRDKLGWTPLAEVPGPPGGARIVAKYEFANPFGSVKDRTAYALLCRTINAHTGPEPLRIIDASAGNMARALAGLGELSGIPMRLVVPTAIPPSLLEAIRATGAEVDLADASGGLIGMIKLCEGIVARDQMLTPLIQHRNMANVAAHEFGTGREILEQLGSQVPDAWVGAIGTGGTLAGVARALRQVSPQLSVTGVTPQEMPYGTPRAPYASPRIAGAGGFGNGLRQPFVDNLLPNASHYHVSYEDALRAMLEYRRQTNTYIGSSSAAAWLAAKKIAETLRPDQLVVTLFADAGTKEDWAKAEQLDT
ncbi:pyridoxal-phosphate dependent enzyme [Goodfellowiella coeruleoviolacea]|uniref:Cysteine synthase A n=1 Tax=Goodfellowiella coeruleoviolacea TaxID=334858 RepID=A0AAE3G7U5_9PSEU|nr:pyridoxal-phosphate dependent enzyme [Goodfellowiella coeruleoviolacea]MCP2163301.1 cysteine synthase A [Goodfellowiella coeruleoviolacea]